MTLTVGLLGSGLLIFLFEVANIHRVCTGCVGFFLLLLVTMEIIFLKRPTRRNSKLVEMVGAIYMMGVFVSGAVGFFLL